jgi:hypothetical protein
MDQLRARLDALESQVHILHQQIRAVERRRCWWRRLACGVAALGLLTSALPSGTAQEDAPAGGRGSLAQRLAALEQKLKHLTLVTTADELPEVRITGANLRLVNGLGHTFTANGLGNLLVGYNEPRSRGTNTRTGSHNVVVGMRHNFSEYGGLVVGLANELNGPWAAVSGGTENTAYGAHAAVSGGAGNIASGGAAVSGGFRNTANGAYASVSGGLDNVALGDFAAVCGGRANRAYGDESSVSGGLSNSAEGRFAAVGGGVNNAALGISAAVSGGARNQAKGVNASVSGGTENRAEGSGASVSGGLNNVARGQHASSSGGK